eukprot:g1709.t1
MHVSLVDAASENAAIESKEARLADSRARHGLLGRCDGEGELGAEKCSEMNVGLSNRARRIMCEGRTDSYGCEWHPGAPPDARCLVERMPRRPALPLCDLRADALVATGRTANEEAAAAYSPGAAPYTVGAWVRSPAAVRARRRGCSARAMAGFQCDHWWKNSMNAAGRWLNPRRPGFEDTYGKFARTVVPRDRMGVFQGLSDGGLNMYDKPLLRDAEEHRMRAALEWEWRPLKCDLRPLGDAADLAAVLQGHRGGADRRRPAQRARGRRLLFAGDSLTEQMFAEARCVLGRFTLGWPRADATVEPSVALVGTDADAEGVAFFRAVQARARARAHADADADAGGEQAALMAAKRQDFLVEARDSLSMIHDAMTHAGLSPEDWKKLEYFETAIEMFELDPARIEQQQQDAGAGAGAGVGGATDDAGDSRRAPASVSFFRANNLLRTLYEFDHQRRRDGLPPPRGGALFDRAWRVLLRGSAEAVDSRPALPPMEAGDVLVLNAGAHFAAFGQRAFSDHGRAFWRATARAIARHLPPGALVVFRTLYTGAHDCHVRRLPSAHIPKKWIDGELPELPYNWAQFAGWNREIVKAFEAEFESADRHAGDFVVLNVTAFSLRPDGRKLWIWHDEDEEDKQAGVEHPMPRGFDCLHFASPGPLREMLRLLAHLLEDNT